MNKNASIVKNVELVIDKLKQDKLNGKILNTVNCSKGEKTKKR